MGPAAPPPHPPFPEAVVAYARGELLILAISLSKGCRQHASEDGRCTLDVIVLHHHSHLLYP